MKKDDLRDLEELAQLISKSKEVPSEKLWKKGLQSDTKELIEPFTDTIDKTGEKYSKKWSYNCSDSKTCWTVSSNW